MDEGMKYLDCSPEPGGFRASRRRSASDYAWLKTSCQDRPDRVLEADRAVLVAGHARQAGDDRGGAGRLERVADDLDRADVEPPPPGADQQVALKAVREVEDDLSAGVLERLEGERIGGEVRPEREPEEVAG